MNESSVKKNIIANFIGKAWTSIMLLVFTPLYIKLIGIEAYGLIGIFVSLTALLSILDMGLSATLSRELARLSASGDTDQESRDLVRTLEFVYWGTGMIIGLGLMMLASPIAAHWIKTEGLSAKTVERAVMIMGLITAFQWPASLYSGGLMGLQRQVLLNGIRGIMATIQHAGAVVVLWLVSPSILTYFAWMVAISIVQSILLARAVWVCLPETHQKNKFQRYLLRKNWKFAAGMMSISIMATILTQADKILLSKLLTLTMFGYYILAFNLANVVILLVNPLFSALFPKFTQLAVENNNNLNVSKLYHKACQLVSVLVLSTAGTLAFYSKEILSIWIRDPAIVNNTHLLLSLLVIGSSLNAFMVLPLTIQLAYGWTNLSFIKNVIAVIILVPLLIWMVDLYGTIGAALVWIILNAGYLLIEIPIMHRHLLRLDMWQWYIKDIGVPLVVVFCTVLMSRILMPHGVSTNILLLWILATDFAALLTSSLFMPVTYSWIRRFNII